MSSEALRKVAEKVVRDLERTKNNTKGSVRTKLEKIEGQIFIINKGRFVRDALYHAPALAEIDPATQKQYVDQVWEELNTYMVGLAKQITKKGRLAEVRAEMLNVKGVKSDDHLYAVKTFSSAQNAKGSKVVEIIKKVLIAADKKYDEELLKEIGGSNNKTGAQIGHADEGFGFAASSVRALRASQIASTGNLAPADKATVNEIFTSFESTIQMEIFHAQIINGRRGLKKSYVPVLSWQGTVDNQTLSNLEAEAIRSLNETFKGLATQEGSTTMLSGIEQVLLFELEGKPSRQKRVTGKRTKEISEKSNGNADGKVTSYKRTIVGRDSTSTKRNYKRRTKANRGVSSSPLALMALLNSQLPRVVAKNMREPYLNYRTGRFAQSVRVTDIQRTPQGYPSIGYTYQKNPYQTFERGYKLGNLEKDPRELIDMSMREIAASAAIGRFYTRRV